MNEDIVEVVGVTGHQVRGPAPEAHEATISRDGRVVAQTITLLAARAEADARGLPRLSVVHEDIVGIVGVTRYQVRGPALEGHEASIRGYRRTHAEAVSLNSARADADDRRLCGLEIMDEDLLAGGAAGDQ